MTRGLNTSKAFKNSAIGAAWSTKVFATRENVIDQPQNVKGVSIVTIRFDTGANFGHRRKGHVTRDETS